MSRVTPDLEKLAEEVRATKAHPPDSPGGKDRIGNADEQPLSVVDRADALTALIEAFSVPSANVLLQGPIPFWVTYFEMLLFSGTSWASSPTGRAIPGERCG